MAKMLGGILLGLAIFEIATSLTDIKRYVRISMM